MMKYKVLFIDEEKRQHDEFADFMDNYQEKVELTCCFPQPTLDATIAMIDELHPDAVVSDFKLNDIKEDITYNVDFDGSELMDAYLDERPGFPCFVLTSFDDQAIYRSHDLNIVYLKRDLHPGKDDKITFADRIIQKIVCYQTEIAQSQDRLNELIELRRNNEATSEDEQELIELDSFLERSLGKKTQVPVGMKELSNMNRLNELIGKANEILAKLEGE
jgi:DNA-binding NarL/FixJ family response regulator